MQIDEGTPGHCILPDSSRTRLLVTREDGADGGAWSLPTVRVNEEWWSPNWLGRIIAQVRRTLGAEVTVLRHVQGAPVWVLELENRSGCWEAPAGWRWAAGEDIDSLRWATPGLREPLRAWFAEASGGSGGGVVGCPLCACRGSAPGGWARQLPG